MRSHLPHWGIYCTLALASKLPHCWKGLSVHWAKFPLLPWPLCHFRSFGQQVSCPGKCNNSVAGLAEWLMVNNFPFIQCNQLVCLGCCVQASIVVEEYECCAKHARHLFWIMHLIFSSVWYSSNGSALWHELHQQNSLPVPEDCVHGHTVWEHLLQFIVSWCVLPSHWLPFALRCHL